MAVDLVDQVLALAPFPHNRNVLLELGLIKLAVCQVAVLERGSEQERSEGHSKGKMVVLFEVDLEILLFSFDFLVNLGAAVDLLFARYQVLLDLQRVGPLLSESLEQNVLLSLDSLSNHQRRDFPVEPAVLMVDLHSSVDGVIDLEDLFLGVLPLLFVQVGLGDLVNGLDQERLGAKGLLNCAAEVHESLQSAVLNVESFLKPGDLLGSLLFGVDHFLFAEDRLMEGAVLVNNDFSEAGVSDGLGLLESLQGVRPPFQVLLQYV